MAAKYPREIRPCQTVERSQTKTREPSITARTKRPWLTLPGPSTILHARHAPHIFMPAISLGLAEVEERLRALRRRLNVFTALHAVFLSLGTIVFAIAVLIVLGLRASSLTFRIATWSDGVLAVVVVAGCILFL